MTEAKGTIEAELQSLVVLVAGTPDSANLYWYDTVMALNLLAPFGLGLSHRTKNVGIQIHY